MPPTTDDPVRNLLPTFAAPPMSDLGTEATPPEQVESPPPPASNGKTPRVPEGKTRRLYPDGVASPDEPPSPRPDDLTPTDTSSPASKPTVATTAGLLAAAIGMAAVAAATIVRWRLQRTLRQPTKGQRVDIATPLARIALRHADLSWLNKDLADALEAGNAVGAYINDGDLLLPLHPDAGVPDNLQESE